MRTQKQIEANYTELIHAGEGITVEKGKISATGGSGGGVNVITPTYDAVNNTLSIESSQIDFNAINVLISYDPNGESNWYIITAVTAVNIVCIVAFETGGVITFTFRNVGNGRYVHYYGE